MASTCAPAVNRWNAKPGRPGSLSGAGLAAVGGHRPDAARDVGPQERRARDREARRRLAGRQLGARRPGGAAPRPRRGHGSRGGSRGGSGGDGARTAADRRERGQREDRAQHARIVPPMARVRRCAASPRRRDAVTADPADPADAR